MSVVNVTADRFDEAVLTASSDRAVVVDFWAPWCGPCRQLSPLLEKHAARNPDVTVVKVNVDEAPVVARRYGIQGIPAVKAFRNGKVVAEFTGLQPDAVIGRFFAALAPSEADTLVARALAAPDGERETLLRRALDGNPGHAKGILALAELLADRGDVDEALALLARIETDPEAQRLAARLRIDGATLAEAELDALRERVERGDGEARLVLGRALAAAGRYEDALAVLLDAVTDPATRDAARAALLEIFAVLGDDAELVRRGRRQLAAALF